MEFEKRYCRNCGHPRKVPKAQKVSPRWNCEECGQLNIGGDTSPK